MREAVMVLVALGLIFCSLAIILELLQNEVLAIVLSFITIFTYFICFVLIMIDMLL